MSSLHLLLADVPDDVTHIHGAGFPGEVILSGTLGAVRKVLALQGWSHDHRSGRFEFYRDDADHLMAEVELRERNPETQRPMATARIFGVVA